MKKAVILLLVIVPLVLVAQKPVKPNLNKAINSWKAGKLDEAKDMIDVCIGDEKLKVDAKTWFYRGLIYASIDTTEVNTSYKALSPNAFEVSMDAFAKADELNKTSKNELFYQDAMGLPVTKSMVLEQLGYYYLNAGAVAYQDDDFDGALAQFMKTQKIMPKDTTAFFYAGFVAQANEDYDASLSNLEKYISLGGKSPDAYALIYSIYQGPKDDKEKALKVVQDAKKKFPADPNFPKYEIGLLIDLDRIDNAKKSLEEEVKREPNNKIIHFYLGYVNSRLELYEDAKKNFNDALKIDPTYFDAQYYLAQVYLIDADKVKREMDNLGISADDKKKKLELDKQLVEKYKVALPYWEKAEKMNPSDTEVLDKLSIIYYYLGDEKNEKRVSQRLKELGVDDN
jgi:tetratricopeptide (TPR) repeat protein